MKNKLNHKGFTLIELLVVVLIIGILAGIALPKYQTAVDKAEFAKLQTMAVSLRTAYNDYMMVRGKGTKKFDELAITLPSDFQSSYTGTFNCISNATMFCCMSDGGSNYYASINCGKNDLSFSYIEAFLGLNNTDTDHRGKCLALPDNARANKLCNGLGTRTGTTNTWTPQGYSNTYNYYVLNK